MNPNAFSARTDRVVVVNVGFFCSGVADRDFHLLEPVFSSAGIQLVPFGDISDAQDVSEFRAVILKDGPLGYPLGFSNTASSSGLFTGSSFFHNPLEVIGWAERKENFFNFLEKGVLTQEIVRFDEAGDLSEFVGRKSGKHFLLGKKGFHQLVDLDSEEGRLKAERDLFAAYGRGVPLFVKKDVEHVLSSGWVSFYFFGGRVSHATKTTLEKNVLSGTLTKAVTHFSPSEEMVEAAAYALAVTDDIFAERDFGVSMANVLYTRLDFSSTDGKPTLYDWSFFDTDLHLELHPQAATRALKAFLKNF